MTRWPPVVTATAVLLGLCACGDAEPAPPPSEGPGEAEVREIFLDAPPVEGGEAQLFSAPRPTLGDALVRLDAVARDEDAKGLFLRVGPLGGAWGRAADLRAALAAIREAHKPIHCHFDVADNLAFWLMASSCDRISMTPAGDLDLVGVAAYVFFARSLLENAGLRADLMQMGRYKGAADPFTRDEMPEETRESLGAVLDDLQSTLVQGIAAGRHLEPERVAALLDEGPFDATHARERGLVDDVGFDDEAREHIRREAHVGHVRLVQLTPGEEPMGLLEILQAFSGEAPETTPEGPRVALVYLEGNIVDEEESGIGSGRSGPFVRAMRSFADDDDIKAVVLRIDSPGGSALASDRMWHAVRRVAKRKPVIVSVGDMAASGGYYIASAATEILAHDSSLVGSIGVVGGKVSVGDLADRLGVHVEVLQRGRNAAWLSPMRPFTDEERIVIGRMLRATYRRFVRRVAEGRDMPSERVGAAAEGRLWSGRRAREAGLVDAEGGLWEALRRARQQGGVSEWAPVERWPRRAGLLEAIAQAMGGSQPGDRTRAILSDIAALAGPVAEAAMVSPLLLGRERVAVALPYVLRVE